MLRRFLSFLFKHITQFRVVLYQRGFFKTVKINSRVISVGNISVGGAGKTPMSIWITQKMNEQGFKTALIEKGYKSSLKTDEVFISDESKDNNKNIGANVIGDEPTMALKALAGKALLCVSKDKTNGAVELIKKHPELKCAVVDDGFQHLKLYRDLDIVLIDAQEGFSGKLIPMGKLRESYSALKRAHVLVFTKSDNLDDEIKKDLCSKALDVNGDLKIFFANVRLFSSANLKDVKILPVSAVSNYGFFHTKLKSSGAVFERYIAHRDHHSFCNDDVEYIVKLFKSTGADFVAYTSKDAVKIKEVLTQKGIPTIEVWYEHEIDKAGEFLKLCIG